MKYWLNILAYYYSESIEERHNKPQKSVFRFSQLYGVSIISCFKFLQKTEENQEELHTKIARLHPYSNPNEAEFPVVSDFTERFLPISSRTIAADKPSPLFQGKQYNKTSHFALD